MTHKLERLIVFCPHCSFSTNRKFNLKRHLNNKHIDKFLNHGILPDCVPDVPPAKLDVALEKPNVPSTNNYDRDNNETVDNITQNSISINSAEDREEENEDICDINNKSIKCKIKKYKCVKCNKQYDTKRHYVKHEHNCTGVDVLTCPKCMISFTSRQHKNKHIKANKCKAKSIVHARTPLHPNQEPLSSNQQNIQITQKIHIHNYGSERMDYMDYEKYLQIFKKCYDIPSAITKEIHFNIEFPENHNIIYNNERTAIVKVDDKFIYKDLRLLVEELIKEKSRLVQEFARENKEDICNTLSNEIYDQIIDLLLKLVLIKEPSAIYKKQVKMIIDMVRNTKLDTTELIKRSSLTL